MNMCTLGMAEEVRGDEIGFNSLWPRTMIATAAVQNLLGGDEAMARSRRPEIMADAAYEVFTRPSRECTGNFFIDEDLLDGDLGRYRYGDAAEENLAMDLFL